MVQLIKAQKILINRNPKLPVFHALPKLHKKINPPPGHPIVKEDPWKKAGTYVDDALRPYVLTMPPYLRDSTTTADYGSSNTPRGNANNTRYRRIIFKCTPRGGT